MSVKLPYDTCQVFIDTNTRTSHLTALDVRLGQELVIADPEMRIRLTRFFNGEATFALTDEAIGLFKTVNSRTLNLLPSDIKSGFERLVEEPEFRQSCIDRWAFLDGLPVTTAELDIRADGDE